MLSTPVLVRSARRGSRPDRSVRPGSGSPGRPRRPASVLAAVAAMALALGACSSDPGDDGAAGTEGSDGSVELSAAGETGRRVAEDAGCSSCHSVDGSDGVGPTWKGLAGSEVVLDDGTTVTADEEYLTAAIVDPNSQIVEGFRGIMPERSLDPDEVAAIVAYLQDIGSDQV